MRCISPASRRGCGKKVSFGSKHERELVGKDQNNGQNYDADKFIRSKVKKKTGLGANKTIFYLMKKNKCLGQSENIF